MMIRIAQADDVAPAIPAIPDRRGDIGFHPLAEIFPLIEGADFDELVDSIRANGLREPIVLYDNQILDGRNRYRACGVAGVAPTFKPFPGGDPIEYVTDINGRRRHMNESQRAMVAAKLANLASGQRADRSAILPTLAVPQPKAAKLLNVGVRTLRAAKVVLEHGTPEEIKAVEQGTVRVATVEKAIHAKIPPTQRKQRRKEGPARTDKVHARIETQRINGQVWTDLRESLEKLSGLPLPSDVVGIVRAHKKEMAGIVNSHLPQALQWIKEFSDAWSNRDEVAA